MLKVWHFEGCVQVVGLKSFIQHCCWLLKSKGGYFDSTALPGVFFLNNMLIVMRYHFYSNDSFTGICMMDAPCNLKLIKTDLGKKKKGGYIYI